MSKRASQVLQTIRDTADTAANHPAWWSKGDNELIPDLYQIQLSLETLQTLRGHIARAELELEAQLPHAAERARLEYQAAR